MGDYVKVPKEMFEPLAELVRIGLFRDEKDTHRGIIREQAKSKIYYYEKEINEMKRKYLRNEWGDFIQWESYEEALRYWTEVEERVKGKVK